MDLWLREARLFKYGSGTGTNFSNLRAENESLSGGGKSSGLMSWLKIGDRAAGAIKSGGTTRRAAKMVCLDMDHPDIAHFINWKVREEIKVAALVEGLKAIQNEKASKADSETVGQTAARLGLKLDYDFNGESYQTVSGQNSNNSVRIPDSFFDAVDDDADWSTVYRTSGKVAKTYKARALWDDIAYAAWRCADQPFAWQDPAAIEARVGKLGEGRQQAPVLRAVAAAEDAGAAHGQHHQRIGPGRVETDYACRAAPGADRLPGWKFSCLKRGQQA
jgi:ribonucleoside-diphosphate reductase alpha chain